LGRGLCIRGADVGVGDSLVDTNGGGGLVVDADGDKLVDVEAGRLKLQVLGGDIDIVDIGLAAVEGVRVGGPEAVGNQGVNRVRGEGDLEGKVGDVAAKLGGGDSGGNRGEDKGNGVGLHGCLS
jgi:hypothetical protein